MGGGWGEGCDAHDLTVEHIGADGDGVAHLPNGDPTYLPYTLPSERVHATNLTRRAQAWTADAQLLTRSPDRQPAPCPHFGTCGGCSLQHWQDAPYAAWKTAQLAAALTRAGYPDAVIEPLARTPPADRRRIDLAIIRIAGSVQVGLHRHRSREVVDLHTCLVLDPRLVALIGALRRVLQGVSGLRRNGSAVATLLDSGIDLLLRTDGPLTAADRTALTGLAQGAGLCRISSAVGAGLPEPAAQMAPALLTLAGVEIGPPPGAFLQASRAGEAAITAAVLAGLPDRLAARARIDELYAGCGTLTFAMASHARIVAFEGDPAAYAALRRAAAGRRVDPVLRDLARQPLTAKEMAGAAAIVLDPPYAGAVAQMPAIAASGVPRVIYVSCNPGALARDARALHTAGYHVLRATPVDQFLWSAAIESVVVFARH